MKKLSSWIVAAFFAFTFVFGLAALSDANSGRCGACPEMDCPGAQNLSPEQRETARKLFEEFRTSTDAVHKQLIIKDAELRAEMDSQKPDVKKVRSLHQEIGTLRGQMAAAKIELNSKLKAAGLPTGKNCGGHGPHGGKGYGRPHAAPNGGPGDCGC